VRGEPRQGSILLLATAVIILIFAFTAFTIDVGWISLTKSQLQNAVDSAALAAAMELDPQGEQEDVVLAATTAAKDLAALHAAGDHESVSLEGNLGAVEFGRSTYNPGSGEYSYAWGPTATPYNVVRVTARRTADAGGDNRLPLFFAPVIGHTHAGLEVTAVATFQPRDIALVLDYSASMNDDSELGAIDTLGQSAIENNILQMWQQLGSPTYGNMGFWPDWVTIPGPHADVTWRSEEVGVTPAPAQTLQSIKLWLSNGTTKTYSGAWTAPTNFSYQSKRITDVQLKFNGSWDPKVEFYCTECVASGLGLDSVPYPYPSGSWDDYIEYCTSHNSSMPWYDNNVSVAGYRRKFGILTLINFWNLNKPMYSETPDLWKVSQQPITALKDATDLFLDYLLDNAAEDQVSLSVYTHPSSNGALLESPLTTDYNLLKTISRQRQAGHYDHYTNIGAGIRMGRIELENNARPRAHRMMILMTDGIANRTLTSATPKQFALDEAALCAASNIRIITVSVGAGADTALMQQIADLTGGTHFNVPGGSSVAQYEAELQEVFGEIAADRPLKLIGNPE
jgi:hypothetical protein